MDQSQLSITTYLLVKLSEFSISAVHIPFLVPDPDKHLVGVVSIGATPPLNDRRNPHTHKPRESHNS